MLASAPALAQDSGRFTVGAGLSTLGPTLEAGYRVNARLGLRVPAGYFDYDFDETEAGIRYDVETRFGGLGLLGDFYPAGGGLRLSAGALINRYALDGRGRGDGEIGGTEYSDVDLTLEAEPQNAVMPMLSVGYDGRLGARWMLSADLGAMFPGGYDIRLRDRSGQVSEADLASEIDDLEDDLPGVLPYVKFTAAFRF